MTQNRDVYARQGFGAPLGMKPPFGLLLVDFVNGFADPDGFGGGNIGAAIERSRLLLDVARGRRWPIVHTRIVFSADGADANVFTAKVPSLLSLTEDCLASQIVDELAPVAGEYIVRKTGPSAFFGTNLAAWLTQRDVASLLVAGCVTSGCVRASVVDAMCYGFRPVVVEDCVGDRAIEPHAANLFDIRQKYADVLFLSEVLEQIGAVDV